MGTIIQFVVVCGPILLGFMGICVSVDPPAKKGKAHLVWLGAFALAGSITAWATFQEMRSSDATLAQIAGAMGVSSNTPPQTLADQITSKITPAQIAQATTQQMNGGDTYAFLEIDPTKPLDGDGRAMLMVASKGTAAIPLVQWHGYPPGSKSNPDPNIYLDSYPELNGFQISLNGGPYNANKIKPGSYSFDFKATNGDWEEDISIIQTDGKLSQKIVVNRNGKQLFPIADHATP